MRPLQAASGGWLSASRITMHDSGKKDAGLIASARRGRPNKSRRSGLFGGERFGHAAAATTCHIPYPMSLARCRVAARPAACCVEFHSALLPMMSSCPTQPPPIALYRLAYDWNSWDWVDT